MRKRARTSNVVHFALLTRSMTSYCSFISREVSPTGLIVAPDNYEIDLDYDPLPYDTPVTCIMCLAEAGPDVA